MDEPYALRTLGIDDIDSLAAIDRSELMTQEFYLREGALVSEPRQLEVRKWSGDWLADVLAVARKHQAEGATLFGLYDGETLAAAAQVSTQPMGPRSDTLQFTWLHVSRPYRRQGLATRLMRLCQDAARAQGARYLYISATPSNSAIGFYLSQGAYLNPEIDPEQFALEPDDIHLRITL